MHTPDTNQSYRPGNSEMQKFGWNQWHRLHAKFRKSGRKSIERWGLAYLHSESSLDSLAYSVASALNKNGRHSIVYAESIWIDGTPQAVAETPSGSQIKCELADLLFIIEEKSINGNTQKETGLLIQGKATPKHNKLTSGSSTKKERQLLECMDRSKPIKLYRATKISHSSEIGSYKLNGTPFGMGDCSRYLLMPKFSTWRIYDLITYPLDRLTIAPFQVGWPRSIRSPYLQSPRGIVEAVQRMVLFGEIGKEITNPSTCEWSRLVNDLRGNYLGSQMAGYGGQERINTSSEFCSFSYSSAHATRPNTPPTPPNHPPHGEASDTQTNVPPSISILKLTIVNIDEDDLPT